MTSGNIFTIGHSTRSIEEFINLLKKYDIDLLADIRQFPGSKYTPQFNRVNLEASLKKENIQYVHSSKLGGRRKAKENSIHTGWRNSGFRGFADYMQTSEFAEGLSDLLDFSMHHTTAIMCAEAVPWRCHRSLVADALIIRNIKVINIISVSNSKEHLLTPFAKVDGLSITYPLQDELF